MRMASTGKVEIIKQCLAQHQHLALIGDGMNDLSAASYVSRFIGFGGAFIRARVREKASYYLPVDDLCGVLPLLLTPEEIKSLPAPQQQLCQRGVNDIEQGETLVPRRKE